MTAPSSAGWTLANINSKVRLITGRPSSDQLSDDQITAYINDYYVYTMPFELKEQITNQFLTFTTIPGKNQYAFPGGYFTDQPGAYADGFPLVFYQDPDIFYQDWPLQYAVDNIATGDGVTVSFSGGLQNPPVIIGSLFIASDDPSGGQMLMTDNGTSATIPPNGTLSGDGSGTINYLTGAYTADFNSAPASSAVIYAKYIGYSGNRPQGILFFNNTFTLMPCPDQAYSIQMQGYIVPTLLTNPTDSPLQNEWGSLIAYGAALQIFADSGDMDNYDRYFDEFKRQENIALGRTIQQLTSQQSVPRF